MTTFAINEQNEIVAFATPEEAAANSATAFDCFSNADELAQLATGWPAERLLAVWNGLPGLTPATEIKDAAKAAKVIFKRLEKNGSKPVREKKPKGERKAKGRAQGTQGAAGKGKSTQKADPAKAAPKAKKAAKGSKPAAEAKAARAGSKSEEVIAMLKRKGGATLAEIIAHTGWQKHTTRGWVSGFLGKKMAITVESYKSDKGERTYRIKP